LLIAVQNCRTTFQRSSDARFFHGWVADFNEDLIAVRSSIHTLVTPGENLHFHFYGYGQELLCNATLMATEVAHNSYSVLSDGSSVVDASIQMYRFEDLSKFKILTSDNLARFQLEGYTLNMLSSKSGASHEVQLLDISQGGLGIALQDPIHKGDVFLFEFESAHGLIQFSAEVRYVAPLKNGAFTIRAGLQYTGMDRLNKGKFESFWKQLVDLNKVHLDIGVAV